MVVPLTRYNGMRMSTGPTGMTLPTISKSAHWTYSRLNRGGEWWGTIDRLSSKNMDMPRFLQECRSYRRQASTKRIVRYRLINHINRPPVIFLFFSSPPHPHSYLEYLPKSHDRDSTATQTAPLMQKERLGLHGNLVEAICSLAVQRR